MDLAAALNTAAAVFALGAAGSWAVVAATNVPRKELTIDMTHFHWLTEPLARQSRWNRNGALCAALAALFQLAAGLVPVFGPADKLPAAPVAPLAPNIAPCPHAKANCDPWEREWKQAPPVGTFVPGAKR